MVPFTLVVYIECYIILIIKTSKPACRIIKWSSFNFWFQSFYRLISPYNLSPLTQRPWLIPPYENITCFIISFSCYLQIISLYIDRFSWSNTSSISLHSWCYLMMTKLWLYVVCYVFVFAGITHWRSRTDCLEAAIIFSSKYHTYLDRICTWFDNSCWLLLLWHVQFSGHHCMDWMWSSMRLSIAINPYLLN